MMPVPWAALVMCDRDDHDRRPRTIDELVRIPVREHVTAATAAIGGPSFRSFDYSGERGL
jgi:hypothetical protein